MAKKAKKKNRFAKAMICVTAVCLVLGAGLATSWFVPSLQHSIWGIEQSVEQGEQADDTTITENE